MSEGNLETLQTETREYLSYIESAESGEFLQRIGEFVRFARKQPYAYNSILIDELEAQYHAFKSDPSFTGLSQYALICALWERPAKDAIPILLKILAEDPNAPHEEIVQILMQVADVRAVEPLLSLLDTLDDENDEYGHLRAAIVEALGAIGSKRALPALHRVLQTVSQDTLKLAEYTQWAIEQLSNE